MKLKQKFEEILKKYVTTTDNKQGVGEYVLDKCSEELSTKMIEMLEELKEDILYLRFTEYKEVVDLIVEKIDKLIEGVK